MVCALKPDAAFFVVSPDDLDSILVTDEDAGAFSAAPTM
jgi:hypothetical protein